MRRIQAVSIGLGCCLLWLATLAGAADFVQRYPQARQFFSEADRFGKPVGQPPATPVYRGETLLGQLFLTDEVNPIPAYSGKPVNMLVGIDTEGTIVGAEVIEHSEPILLIGIAEQALDEFVAQYIGKSADERVRVGPHVDAISGATVTVMVMSETIMRSARKVHATREQRQAAPDDSAPSGLRADFFEPADWATLVENGAIGHLHLTRGEVDAAFRGSEAEGVDTAPAGAEDETFIDLYYAYLDLPVIGRNLLGDSQYQWLMSELDEGEHAIAVLANGRYSFKGSGYVRGGIFDRIQLQQGGQGISFRDMDHHRLSDVYAEGMPRFREMDIFIVRDEYAFDPARDWQLELLVRRQTGPLDSVFVGFSGGYRLPDAYRQPTAEPAEPAEPATTTEPAAPAVAGDDDDDDEPIWVMVWRDRVFHISVLSIGLLVLSAILIFQDWLVRRPRLLVWLRTGFLLYTVVFIGWYALAQLSVVNVLTFTNAVFHDFQWDTFLIDPMLFILWAFVAMSLLLWGRGVYCGWLCPYGAIQDLVNKLARRLKVPQFEVPFVVHERLWALKYIILLALFGISLQSLADAEVAAEVEPFKTAITLQFQREWGFVLYAGGLIAVSAFNHKFYCRYLCPLGAALAIPARIRLFDWLKRHNECGKPCQICAHECEIQAIHPTGQINPNECHYCLDCQVNYFDDRKCPPVVAKRKRRERAVGARESVKRIEKTLNTSSGLDRIGVKVEHKRRHGEEQDDD